MNIPIRTFVQLALAAAFLLPATFAQKPPAPGPPPSSGPPTSPGRSSTPPPVTTSPAEPTDTFVMYLSGRVATDDGTPVPNDAMVERVCNARVLQQVHANFHGDFTMDLGTRTDTYVDATGEGSTQIGRTNNAQTVGIPRRDLSTCELRASVAGFRSNIVSLVELSPVSSSIDVGSITVHRTAKVKGLTLDAAPYQAPKDARKAYENGIQAARKGRLDDARQQFEKAVAIYPKYTSAWYQLGLIVQKQGQKESAQTDFTRATSIDSKFLPPFLSLASFAFETNDWPQVLSLTNHVLELDPLKYSDITGYILDLDSVDYAQAYFYNSAANFNLNKFLDAEKSGLKAERLDVRPRYPQLHLLLAEIFARKNDFAKAISETKIYLEFLPNAQDAVQVRERLARFEKLNDPSANAEKTSQN
jgi:hypothetical protein